MQINMWKIEKKIIGLLIPHCIKYNNTVHTNDSSKPGKTKYFNIFCHIAHLFCKMVMVDLMTSTKSLPDDSTIYLTNNDIPKVRV